jgi:hypothetical protein
MFGFLRHCLLGLALLGCYRRHVSETNGRNLANRPTETSSLSLQPTADRSMDKQKEDRRREP